MRCHSCQHENPAEARFCMQCGSKLGQVCPACQHLSPLEAKFCMACGTSLLTQLYPPVPGSEFRVPSSTQPRTVVSSQLSVASPQPPAPSPHSPAERRQLTVMFCDVVGSTALSTQLDPEEFREVIRAYQEICAAAIARFAGHLAKYIGDGVLAYFSYPLAHEDDAQRAVHAGLEIVAAIQKMAPFPFQWVRRIQVRVGIHTGLVVVGEMGAGDTREPMAIVGETPNIAARLQEIAKPNTVVLSSATHQLIEGYFPCQSLSAQSLKGVTAPVELYQVLGEGSTHTRLEVAETRGLTPFVGREQELGLLQERWEQAKEGHGQVVLLTGEAGIGKSRLVQTLKGRVAGKPYTRLEAACSPYHQNSALYPVIALLQRELQFTQGDSPEQKLQKLERAFPLDTVPLFTSLLSLPLPNHYPSPGLTPQKQKEKTQLALLTWLLQAANRQPTLLVWEDLHWADPSTLELLGLVLDQVPTTRLLLVLTCRPDFIPPWTARSHLTSFTLNRLNRKQVETMIAQVAADKALSTEVIQQVVTKTDGVPLFVEELTKTVAESVGATDRSSLQIIPATLQDSLMARLDRLGTTKEVAQLAATLGREFSYELLRAVSPLDEESLQQSLARLVDAELLYQRGVSPNVTYLFKHALLQDTAYQSLLKSTRRQYHQQIAHVLEERFGEIKETQPELLAHHYTEAGLTEQAIPYWQKAGERATQRSANVEAIAHLTKGLALLKTLPTTPERASQELMLQIALGPPLQVTKGFSAPEVAVVYAQARELCRRLGETPELFSVLRGLRLFYVAQAEHRTARELAEQLLTLAQSQQNPQLLIEAHMALGQAMLQLGEFVLAREHLEQGIALYDPQKHHAYTSRGEHDPGVGCRSLIALVLWSLGYPDQALKRSQEALTLAQEIAHPVSFGLALYLAGILHEARREVRLTQERAEAAITLSTEQGLLYWSAGGRIARGWALTEQGRAEEGIAQIRQNLNTLRTIGTEIQRPAFLGLLAQAYEKVGQIQEGLGLVAEALDIVNRTEERMREAELYRIKGELTLQKLSVVSSQLSVTDPRPLTPDLQGEAEACFLKAIAIARKQQAKSWELRATTSLARLWQQQGKQTEARQILAEIYNWFTEGFDTKDLQEANALLDELRH